jgi:cysteine desulfurase
MKELFSKRITDFTVNGKKYVNLDNAATTPPLKCVEEGVSDYLTAYGSVHRGAGEKSKISTDVYEQAREDIKKFVGAPKDSYVVYSMNTTGGMNILAHFFSFLEGKVAVSAIEHSSSWLPWIKSEGEKVLGDKQVEIKDLDEINEEIQRLGGKRVLQYGPDKNGEFDLSQIEALLQNNKIKAFVLTASSNLTGYCPKIKEIGEIVHKNGAYYIVDGCQFIQHHEIDMVKMGIDFLAASGHKFYAPYGGGFVIGAKEFLDKFLPYQIGGGNLPYITSDGEFLRYENQLAHDPGTPNAVGAISMAIALNKMSEVGIEKIEKYEMELTRKAYDELSKLPKVKLLAKSEQLTTVIPFVVDGKTAEEVAEELNDYAIGVRAGSFCVYHVIRDLLEITPETEAKIVADVRKGDTSSIPGVVRASFSICNSEEDVGRFIEAMREIAK